MSKRRSTPLNKPDIESHHCSADLRQQKLGMVPFFQQLSPDELAAIEKTFSATHYTSGENIYYQDERATMLRVVVYGAVKLVRQTLKGKEILLNMLQPGEYFGNLSASGRDTYSEAAQAQTDVCILSIRMRDFRSLLEEYPGVAQLVLNITADRLTSSQKQVQNLTTLSVEQRIANILVTLCDKFGEESKHGKLLQLPLSRKDLADMAGTSTETASRIMSGFQEDGLITSGRQWVAINNPDGLKNIAEE